MLQSVLIVDDSVPLHKLVKAHLEPDELETYSAYDGESALAMAATLQPHLILLDVDMPHLDGFEVGRRLKQSPATAGIPLIFLTANSVTEQKVKGLEIGACDYITKPFKPQELRARVRASLRMQREINDTAMIDAGTGIWSRSYLDHQLPGQLSQAKRQGRSLACIVASVDKFNAFTAKHGLAVSNDVLRSISRILLSHCRAEDIVCKFEAGKFALLICVHNRAAASHMAERLRGEVQRQLRHRGSVEIGISCSFGVADVRVNGEATLVNRAETAAHRASQAGNCVVVAREMETEHHAAAQRRQLHEELQELSMPQELREKMEQQLLVIDDSKPIHPLVKAMLAEVAVRIHSAMDAQYGITLAASLRPDLILLDVEMPGMNGFEACKALKANPETVEIPVIFLTSRASVDEKVLGLELGAMDYITKPFNPAELMARVRASLRTTHLIRLLEEKAMIDSLTGLGNRRMFEQVWATELALHTRFNHPISCILLDVDRFKQINDTLGHPTGDKVLQKIAAVITEACRTGDVACRYGGEEFVVIAPHTNASQAAVLAERIRSEISQIPFNHQGKDFKVTCSLGVADAIDTYDKSMVKHADEAMYRSKQQGGNRVSISDTKLAGQTVAA